MLCFYLHAIGWYEDNWYEVNLEAENITCTREQMKMAAEGHLTTEALMWNQNVEEKTISGMSSGDFRYDSPLNTLIFFFLVWFPKVNFMSKTIHLHGIVILKIAHSPMLKRSCSLAPRNHYLNDGGMNKSNLLKIS